MYFTTNRSINLNGVTFSCYDIDLRLYTNSLLLDGYHVRQFRIRTWLSDGDYQNPNMYVNKYDIFMSDRRGLCLHAIGGPYINQFLDQSDQGLNQF